MSDSFLIPVFQSIIDFQSGGVHAREVLARWLKNDRCFGPAEVAGPIDWAAIDAEILLALCQQKTWFTNNQYKLFLNVSVETLQSDLRFKVWIDRIKSFTDGVGTQLVVEITESITDSLLALRWPVLSQLNRVQYAMDDFGDDYSSMQRLIRYPWDYCKFDANKIINLHDFGAVLYCVHNQIEIVAERVENQTLAESVKSLGLILQQGFFHERPKPLFALQPSSYAPPETRPIEA